jgi:hypothetical protein
MKLRVVILTLPLKSKSLLNNNQFTIERLSKYLQNQGFKTIRKFLCRLILPIKI